MKRFIFPLVMVCLLSTSCASTPENLQRETARVVGDISPDQVRLSNIKRGITDVKWDADTPKGSYSCSADDMVRRPYCSKVGEKAAPAPVPQPVPTPPPSIAKKVRSIEEVDFANFTFTLSAPEEDCTGLKRNTVPFRRGEFKEGGEFGSEVSLMKIVYADLTGDNINEAVVPLNCYSHGNYTTTVALVYTLRNGEPVLIGSVGNGNTELDYRKYYPGGFIFPEGGANVEKGKLVFYRSADGSHACPKNRVGFVYTWNGKGFALSGKPAKHPLKNC